MKTFYSLTDKLGTDYFASPKAIADYLKSMSPVNNKFVNRTDPRDIITMEINETNVAEVIDRAGDYVAEIAITMDFSFYQVENVYRIAKKQMYE